MPTLDDEIGAHLAAALAAGELQRTAGWGKPLPELEGWADTPPALRMPFKILKDAGIVPPEVEMMRRRAELRAAVQDLERQAESGASAALLDARRQLSELEQSIALRLESLRTHGEL